MSIIVGLNDYPVGPAEVVQEQVPAAFRAIPDSSPAPAPASAVRRVRPLRFASGLVLTTSGMGMILLIGVRMLEVQQLGGDFALVVVAAGVLTGVTMLGGGFGLMATASSGFDEEEFDRLANAGNISSAPLQIDSQEERLSESAA